MTPRPRADVGVITGIAIRPRAIRAWSGGLGSLSNVLRAYGEGNIFGEAYGDGPVRVVWLHGWGRSSADFASAAALLAHEGVASVALDLPGFGASPLPATAGGAALYARVLTPVLADISAGPLVLVGHSFGGRIATVIAATQSERVRALVLTGVPLVRGESPHRSPLGYRVARALRRRGLISDARMEVARQKYGSSDYRRATGLLRDIVVASVNESYEDELSRITVPVVLVWGENDLEVPVEVARRALARLSNSADAVLDVVIDTGHFVPTERPDALVAHARRLVVGP